MREAELELDAASLDELGREGYELVWVLPDQNLHREKDGHVLIFKRRL